MSKPIKRLICTVGLPRSGKSRFVKYMSHHDPVVCPNDIRLALNGKPYVRESEPFVWATAETMVRYFFQRGHQDVFFDFCNQTVDCRKRWVRSEWETYFCHIDTPADVCRERALKVGDEYIIPVIDEVALKFESLDKDCERCLDSELCLEDGYDTPFTVWRPRLVSNR